MTDAQHDDSKASAQIISEKPRSRPDGRFDLEDARMMMVGEEASGPAHRSKLREVGVGSTVYAVRGVLCCCISLVVDYMHSLSGAVGPESDGGSF